MNTANTVNQKVREYIALHHNTADPKKRELMVNVLSMVPQEHIEICGVAPQLRLVHQPQNMQRMN